MINTSNASGPVGGQIPPDKQPPRCLLYGKLHVTIYEIRNLVSRFVGDVQPKTAEGTRTRTPIPRTPTLMRRISSQLRRLVQSSTAIYATVDLDRSRVAKTRKVQVNNQNPKPKWNQQFHIYCAHELSRITFTIKYDNSMTAVLIGRAHVRAEDVLKYNAIHNYWVDIVDENKKPLDGNPQVLVRMEFEDVTQDINWSQGIMSPDFEGVPNTFFLQRRDCRVTLYQDAHVDDGFSNQIAANNIPYRPQRCWEDIFRAISNAQHLIYIAGWSVFHKIALARTALPSRTAENSIVLGELLTQKASNGVKVLVLVWDDKTSVENLYRSGVMGTHDQETAEYFRNSEVHCVLCPRNRSSERSMAEGFMFTHHQKIVVVDAEVPEHKKRTIVSFLGGLDLCDGRYDTQDHPLFKTLKRVHKEDFHQPNFTGASIAKGGPREPWHDIYCRLEGPVAWDVLYNFEVRWRKQSGEKEQVLLPLDQLRKNVFLPSQVTFSPDPGSWNVQLFRSIDSGSVTFDFPEDLQDDPVKYGLVPDKDNIIDRGIQDAYISAIRRAKNFIYIENQYFLGSSFGWKSKDIDDTNIGALHLIPKELSLKIISKIDARERFSVYVVLPMWPEGVPESDTVQMILDWQQRTMEMMYAEIAGALRNIGSTEEPRDYLTFFCLGNREMKNMDEDQPTEPPASNTNYHRAQQARRFMIYVHSKMMIVDDEYIIIGSANINQRSMDGARDTEIAMGAYQPNHLVATQSAKGQIYSFRLGLWYEHLQQTDSLFDYPEKLDCIQKINQLADRNWELYTKEQFGDQLSHLLRYPIKITSDGIVSSMSKTEEQFPDTNASILRPKSNSLRLKIDTLSPLLTT